MSLLQIIQKPGAAEVVERDIKLSEVRAQAMLQEAIDLIKLGGAWDAEAADLMARGLDQMGEIYIFDRSLTGLDRDLLDGMSSQPGRLQQLVEAGND